MLGSSQACRGQPDTAKGWNDSEPEATKSEKFSGQQSNRDVWGKRAKKTLNSGISYTW